MKNKKSIGLIAGLVCLILIIVLLLTMCNGGTADTNPTEATQSTEETSVATEPTVETTEPATEPEEETEATEPETEPEETTATTGSSKPGGSGSSGSSGSSSSTNSSTEETEPEETTAPTEEVKISDPGTKENPYTESVQEIPDLITSVRISRNEKVYYHVYGVGDSVLTIEDANAVIVYRDKTYQADQDGVVTVTLEDIAEGTPAVFYVSTTAEKAYYKLNFGEKTGGATNPEILESLEKITANLEAGDADGYYYQWTSDSDRILKLTVGSIAPANAGYDVILTVGGKTVSLSKDAVKDDKGQTVLSAEVAAEEPVTIQVVTTAEDHPQVTVEINGHAYTVEVTEPTCTEKGISTYTCACGDSYTENEVEAAGHTYETVVTPPTCTEAGCTTYTCSACGDSYTADETAATGHTYETVVTAPTCTEAGFTTYKCACGDSYTADETAATGHDHVPEVTAPTCTEAGFTTYKCACGDSYTADETAATGHDHVPEVTAPTCTEAGFTTYKCACGDSYTADEVAAAGHAYESQVIDPTTEAQGYTLHTCQICGESYMDNYTDKLPEETEPEETEPEETEPEETEPAYQELRVENIPCQITLDPIAGFDIVDYYIYNIKGAILTFEGEDGIIYCGDGEYYAGDEIYIADDESEEPVFMQITNMGEEELTVTLKLVYPVGHEQNPAQLILGDNATVLEENSKGYYYTWTAVEDGTLRVGIKEESGWTYAVHNTTAGITGEIHTYAEDPAVNPSEITVTKGDRVVVFVNTCEAESGGNPAGTVTVTASFTARPGTAMNPIAVNGEFPIVTEQLAPGAEVYYSVSGANGLEMTISDADAYAIISGNTVSPDESGLLKVLVAGDQNVLIRFGNSGTEAKSFTVEFLESVSDQTAYLVKVTDFENNPLSGKNVYFYSETGALAGSGVTTGTGEVTVTLDKANYTVGFDDGIYCDTAKALVTETQNNLVIQVTDQVVGDSETWTARNQSYTGFHIETGATYISLEAGLNYLLVDVETAGSYTLITTDPDVIINKYPRKNSMASASDSGTELTLDLAAGTCYISLECAEAGDCILVILPAEDAV